MPLLQKINQQQHLQRGKGNKLIEDQQLQQRLHPQDPPLYTQEEPSERADNTHKGDKFNLQQRSEPGPLGQNAQVQQKAGSCPHFEKQKLQPEAWRVHKQGEARVTVQQRQ